MIKTVKQYLVFFVVFKESLLSSSHLCVCVSTAHMPFFSVASDASNHGTTKLFPLSVCYWTPDLGVQTKVLDFYDDSDETSAAIPNQIVTKLEENGLGLDMISAYSADNASLNYGRYNSVFQKLKENNSCILKANCVAHIVHNSAKHASAKYRHRKCRQQDL